MSHPPEYDDGNATPGRRALAIVGGAVAGIGGGAVIIGTLVLGVILMPFGRAIHWLYGDQDVPPPMREVPAEQDADAEPAPTREVSS